MTQRIIAGVIMIGCIILSYILVATKPQVIRSAPSMQTTSVEVRYFNKGNYPAIYEGIGQVVPWRAVTLFSEISGKVSAVSDHFHTGEIVDKDAPLVQLSDQSYQEAVDKSQAELDKSEAQYVIEYGKSAAAKAGADTLYNVTGVQPKDTALMHRVPQLEQALADKKIAQLALDKAKRNLEKTHIKSPIHAMLVSTNVHVGSVVDPSVNIAQLIDVEKYNIQLQLPSHIYAFFQPQGGLVQAVVNTQSQQTFSGTVARTLHHLDDMSRMAQVVVEVRDPLQLEKPANKRSSLIMDDFVNVRLTGHTLSNVVQLPRQFMHAGDVVWIYDDGVLRIQKVKVVYKSNEFVYISDGVESGDALIITPIVAPVDGMKINKKQSG